MGYSDTSRIKRIVSGAAANRFVNGTSMLRRIYNLIIRVGTVIKRATVIGVKSIIITLII